MTAEILALFDAQMRADPPESAGVQVERDGSVVRMIGLWNAVLFWDRTSRDPQAIVAEQARFARENTLELEWKLYEHDGPPALDQALQAEGFEADEPETLMVFELGRQLDDVPVRVPELEIRRVVDAHGVADFVAAGSAAFGQDLSARTDAFVHALGDPTVQLYVAYLGGRAVSSGRLETPPGRAFASIWGGGTAPQFRGLGIYRALGASRAREARRRGYRFLTVDARESSRPILERLGFARLSGVTGWVLRANRSSPSLGC